MSIATIRTVGTAEVDEEVIFVTKNKLNLGERVNLKPAKPITAPSYGVGLVTQYLGPGRDQSHRKYAAVRIQ